MTFMCRPKAAILGKMYSGGGDFTYNIDEMRGKGTAEFVSKAIEIYCKNAE